MNQKTFVWTVSLQQFEPSCVREPQLAKMNDQNRHPYSMVYTIVPQSLYQTPFELVVLLPGT